MELTNRTLAAVTTLAMLLVLFVVPSARADEAGKIQDRFSAETALIVDHRIDHARLAAAATRRPAPTITVETRVGPNTSILTRVPATIASR